MDSSHIENTRSYYKGLLQIHHAISDRLPVSYPMLEDVYHALDGGEADVLRILRALTDAIVALELADPNK